MLRHPPHLFSVHPLLSNPDPLNHTLLFTSFAVPCHFATPDTAPATLRHCFWNVIHLIGEHTRATDSLSHPSQYDPLSSFLLLRSAYNAPCTHEIAHDSLECVSTLPCVLFSHPFFPDHEPAHLHHRSPTSSFVSPTSGS